MNNDFYTVVKDFGDDAGLTVHLNHEQFLSWVCRNISRVDWNYEYIGEPGADVFSVNFNKEGEWHVTRSYK